MSEVVSFQQSRGVPAHYEYAPFGTVTAMTKATTITAFDVRTLNPFRFSSEYADDTLGLVYYNYRHYEPDGGRWQARDMLSECYMHNLYAFCINRPLFFFDNVGLGYWDFSVNYPSKDDKNESFELKVIVSYTADADEMRCCDAIIVRRYDMESFI